MSQNLEEQPLETPESIAAVDDLLASVGLRHGRRASQRAARGAQVAAGAAPAAVPAAELDVLQVPAWRDLPWLMHGFSTRGGGVSSAFSQDRSTGELNLGYNDADSRGNVDANRSRFTSALDWPNEFVAVKQIHSGTIHVATLPIQAAASTRLVGDGLLTDQPGCALAIQTADCIPVLLVDPVNRAIGAFHAGWRGTAKRIVERAVGDMRRHFGSSPETLLAAIGPGIGPCCYAVGEEVIAEFTSQFDYTPSLLTEVSESDPIRLKYPLLFLTARAPGHSDLGPQIHLNLWEANRRQLLDAGVKAENIWVAGECTACHPERYFSYRAEQGFTGRMMAVVGLR